MTYIGVFLRDHRQADAVARDLRDRLAAVGTRVDVYPYTDNRVNPYYAGSMAFLGSLLVFIGTLVTTVVVLGILNSVTLTRYERTREIGTLRALGWRRRQVAALYVREGIILASIGLAAGVVLVLAVGCGVSVADIRFSPPGIPGQVQLVLWPGPLVHLGVAAILLPLLAVAT